MTKKEVREVAKLLIERAWDKETASEDELEKRFYRGQVAGIEHLVYRLKIDMYPKRKGR